MTGQGAGPPDEQVEIAFVGCGLAGTALAAELAGAGHAIAVSATSAGSGTKALYGHPQRALGAIEAAICALAIRNGWAPLSANLVHPDPAIVVVLPGLLHAGREATYRRMLSTSFGFGGLNAALVFGATNR